MKNTRSNNNYNRISLLSTLTAVVISVLVFATACGNQLDTRNIEISGEPIINEDGKILDSISMLSIADVSFNDLEETEEIDDVNEFMSENQQVVFDSYLKRLDNKKFYYEHLNQRKKPEGISGVIYEGYSRDVFLANGTPITICQPDADLSELVHDEELQNALGNGLGPDNRGYGAAIIWEEDNVKKYCIVSNVAQVYGGSYKNNLQSDISITLDGSEANSSYPNISFLFGGGMQADVVGNIDINISSAQCMYVYGGSFNGNVVGNIHIKSTNESWIMETIGGGLAFSAAGNAHAAVFGNIDVDVQSHSTSKSNCIIGGGLAYSDTKYVAVSDVHGDTSVSVSGQKVFEVCGGGLAYKLSKEAGYAMSNVYGDTSVSVDDTSILYDDMASVPKSGIVAGGGLGLSAVAMVTGNSSTYVGNVIFDRKALGVFDGGITSNEFDSGKTCIYGNCDINLLDEMPRYNYFKATNGSITTDNMKSEFERLFIMADSTKLPEELASLSEDTEKELADILSQRYKNDITLFTDVLEYNRIYEEDIFVMMASDDFDEKLEKENSVNMMNVKDFYPDDKLRRVIKIYYPRPSSNYIWRGNE